MQKGYKQTEIGVIPEDWDVKNLIDLSDGGMQNGVFYEVSRKGSGVFFLNVGNLYETAPITTRTLEKFDATINEIERFKVKHGDLFFTRSSIVPSGIAYCNWYKGENDETTVFDSHVVRFKTDTEQVVPMYLYLQCISHSSRKYFISNAKVATMTTIDQNQIGCCRIPVPTYDEQKKIAEALSDVDSMISSLEKLIAKKKAVKQGAMQELLTGKKRLPGFDGDWKPIQLGSVSKIKTGDKNNEQKTDDGKYPFFVRSQQVERINSYSYDGEAILIPGEGNIGQIFHYINGKFDWHQRVYKISDFSEFVCGKYVYYQMKFSFGEHALKNTVKATVDSLRLPTFEQFEFLIPPIVEEQTAIASILSDIDNEIEALEQKLAKTRQIKQGMMQQLLTGKIRLV